MKKKLEEFNSETLEFVAYERGDRTVGIYPYEEEFILTDKYGTIADMEKNMPEIIEEFKEELKKLLKDFFAPDGATYTKKEWDRECAIYTVEEQETK